MRITIIGAGFSGSTLATLLASGNDETTEVCLVGVEETFARGVAYGETRPEHVLNVRAGHLGADPDNPEEVAEWLNLGRQGRVMDPENIMRRQQARDACEALFRHWSEPGFRRTINGMRKLVQFSVSLNVAALDRHQREELIVQLVNGLLLSAGSVLDETIVACEEFLRQKDPLGLMKRLEGGAGYAYSRDIA